MSTAYPKRLIEVDLPIKRISEHARREKSIRHGHISTLHIWWARRPLAACRAVICAALWPDPADALCPQEFRDRAARIIMEFARQVVNDKELRENHCSQENGPKWLALRQQKNALDPKNPDHLNTLRFLLLDFIADFANWDNSTVKEYMETARSLTQAAHKALGGEKGTRPLVVDPFAGGGSIPLEALRVGADAFASDLNPVAVILNKVVLEYIPKYGKRLTEEVRKWGDWIQREAEKELAEFYPKDPDGSTPIAYIWARTIKCEGPGCGAEVPLIRSLWLAKKANRSVALQLVSKPQAKRVDFRIIKKIAKIWVYQDYPNERISDPILEGTLKRSSATCPCCGYTTSAERVRGQFRGRQGGADDSRLLCIVCLSTGEAGRVFRLPSAQDMRVIEHAKRTLARRKEMHKGPLSLIPDEPLPYLRSIFNIHLLGVTQWGQLFSGRQMLALTTLAELVREVGRRMRRDSDSGLASAVETVLGLTLSRGTDLNNSLSSWKPDAECPVHLFGRQAIPIMWDFAEAVPTSSSSGSWEIMIDRTLDSLNSLMGLEVFGKTEQADASANLLPDDSVQVFFTDPPYYDAVPYADLSDFFYVWLKRLLIDANSELFKDLLSPKREEAVQLAERNPQYAYKTKQHFESKMFSALSEARRVTHPHGLGIIVFAHKTTDAWETMLKAVIDSGWIVYASWPIDTECGSRLRAQDSAVLASSVHLVCRPREEPDGSIQAHEVGDWRDVLQELPVRIHEWMPRLASEGVVGADAIFSCLGPALEIFSRYCRVEKASGEVVLLKEYLEQIWAAVSKEALAMIFEGADATGFEEDARLTAIWFWTLSTATDGSAETNDETSDDDEDEEGASSKKKASGGYVIEYDAARKIAQGLGAHLEELANLIDVKGDKARLLPVIERTPYLFGKQEAVTTGRRKKKETAPTLFDGMEGFDEESVSVLSLTANGKGTTVLDHLHRCMILFNAGRGEALKRFLVEEGIGRDQRFWRLAQALSALYPSGSDEKRWVDGVLARKKGLGF